MRSALFVPFTQWKANTMQTQKALSESPNNGNPPLLIILFFHVFFSFAALLPIHEMIIYLFVILYALPLE